MCGGRFWIWNVVGVYELLFNVGIGKCVFDVVERVVVYFFIVGERGGVLLGWCYLFFVGECLLGVDGEVSVVFMLDGMLFGVYELFLVLLIIKCCLLCMFSCYNWCIVYLIWFIFLFVNL